MFFWLNSDERMKESMRYTHGLKVVLWYSLLFVDMHSSGSNREYATRTKIYRVYSSLPELKHI